MKTLWLRLLVLPFFYLVGCSSSRTTILERADDLSDRPDWAKVTVPSYEESKNRYFVGYVEVGGDASPSGALNMADEKALSEPMRSLVDQFLDQNQVGENLRKDAAIGQRIISATRGFRAPMPGLTVVKRYWETAQLDEHTTVLRAYALAEIPVADYEKVKAAYFERLAGNTEMKSILRDVGRRQRDLVLGPDTNAKN